MTETDTLVQFASRLAEAGLVVEHVEADGQLHRCGTIEKPASKNGAYKAFLNNPASLWWLNWATGDSGTICAKSETQLTAAEREAFTRRTAEARAERQRLDDQRHAEAAARAQVIWNTAKPATDAHPYLVRKGVPALGLRLAHDGRLIVPVRDAAGRLVSVQFVNDSGEKRFLTGGQIAGSFFAIPAKNGDRAGPLLIAEGYATSASLRESTGYACLVAFNCGNMLAVGEMARKKYPTREIIICADNDVGTKGNPGVRCATAAAQAVGAKLAVPPLEGRGKMDFNDLYQLRGALAVREVVQAAVCPEAELSSPQKPPSTAVPIVLPLEAFSPAIQTLLVEASEAFTVPQQVPAAALLALVSCLVGRTRAIEAKPGWREHGNVWLVLVAPSGLGKTPVAHAFFKPIEEREYRLFQEWRAAQEAHEAACLDYQKAKPKDRALLPRPQQPERTQHYLDDATEEALADALSQNPRGVMWRVDELSGLLANFNKYSGKEGGTRARLLSAHDCQSWKSGRRDLSRNLHIPAACVSIFGGLQPAMLSRCFTSGDKDSGFLPRFMFIRAEREKPALWSETHLSGQSEELLRHIVNTLASFNFVQHEEGHTPYTVLLTPDAKSVFVMWHDELALEGWENLTDGAADAILQKLKSHGLRLCLLLHCLDAALEGRDATTPVTAETMRRALLLADWVKAHQRQVWQLFTGETTAVENPIERAVMEAVLCMVNGADSTSLTISNAALVDAVNLRLPEPAQPELVGRAASALGVPVAYVGKERGRKITTALVDSFKVAVGATRTVGTVGTVGSATPARDCDHRQLHSEPSAPSEGNQSNTCCTDGTDSEITNCRYPENKAYLGQPTVPTVPTVAFALPDDIPDEVTL